MSDSDSGSSIGDDSMSDDDTRKQQKEQMSMEEGCCICDVSDASNIDPLVYCDQCNLAVHKLCYGIEKIPEDDWFCNTCLYWKKKRSKDPLVDPDSKPIKCVLCDRKGGAMKECYPEKDQWAHMVCALFIEEVSFNDSQTSSGIIINQIPARKKVSATRKCTCCIKEGYVVDCQCETPGCNKKFHITCAQARHQLLMTDNSALAIEADRSTEFKVLCSKEQVQKMKERKRQESENQKKKRAMEEERRKSKDKILTIDPEKRAKLEKIKKLPIMRGKQPVLKANTTTTPTSTTSNSTGLTKEEKEAKKQRKLEKQLLSGQKRKLDKSKDSSKYEKKKRKEERKTEPSESGSRERYRHARDQIYSLYEKFDKTEDESISGPITHFEAFIWLLKDQGYSDIVEECRELWATREKQKRLKERLESLRFTRELMEKQLLVQDVLLYKMSGGIDRDSPLSENGPLDDSPTSNASVQPPPTQDQLNKTT